MHQEIDRREADLEAMPRAGKAERPWIKRYVVALSGSTHAVAGLARRHRDGRAQPAAP